MPNILSRSPVYSSHHSEFVHIPCFCMTLKNLTMTLEEGLIRTWRLPAFSALLMDLSASLRTEVLTILVVGDSQIEDWK